jgi:NAD(P)-dependent dehydrogenase (short-subunit alcohol dehydrogenase family)/quinol monooxygenase YgiN
MLTNLALFRAKPDQAKALGVAMTDLVEPTRREAGCVSYDLHQSFDDGHSWFVYENWRLPEDLDAHMQTAHIQAFLKLAPSLVEGDIDLRRFTMTSTPLLKSGFPSSFAGKNIVVTGANGDLGLAIVQRLITQGANVLAVAGSQNNVPILAATSGSGALEIFVADVSDTKQVLAYATRAFDLWGQIDGFVNNAGIQTNARPIIDFPEEDFDRLMAVNVRGTFLGLKYVLPRMREGGSVVNMSSSLGLVGGAGICAYVTSKHAIIGLTKTAALEQGSRRIRVNACCPGPIAGRMTFKLADEVFAGTGKTFAETVPLGRHGTPKEVAGLVSFLLSDDSMYATGTTHSVDGGFTAA